MYIVLPKGAPAARPGSSDGRPDARPGEPMYIFSQLYFYYYL